MRTERLLYCDFVDPNADPRVYQEVEDIDKLKLVVNDFLEEHNAESKSPMPLARVRVASNECAGLFLWRRRRSASIRTPFSLSESYLGAAALGEAQTRPRPRHTWNRTQVMFLDAIEHVLRIARILRQPQGNALLLGVGGSGRQSMSKMATYISGFELFQVEIAKVSDSASHAGRLFNLKFASMAFSWSHVTVTPSRRL